MSLLARLIEAGTPADLVAEVARELARAELAQEVIEDRRAKDRERQARRRERNADNVMSRDITEQGVTDEQAPSLSRPLSPQTPHTPTHTHPDNTPRARKGDPFPCPDWCETAVWNDLKRNRRTKRLTNTETAHKRFVADVLAMADDDWPPGKLVEAIAAKGWGGAHDPRDDRKPKNDNPKPSGRNAADLARRNLGCH